MLLRGFGAKMEIFVFNLLRIRLNGMEKVRI